MTKIFILGEAYGEKEAEVGRPFVGANGWLLNQMLSAAGIAREECTISNVFNLRPKRNDVATLCTTKAKGLPLPPLAPGKYLSPEYLLIVTGKHY